MSGEWELGVTNVAEVIAEFATALRRDEARLNSLNVFPVPDRDTGANMVRTVDGIVDAIVSVGVGIDSASLLGAVEAAALAGRGNSGLIVGQFLVGFVSVFDGNTVDLAAGLSAGAVAARRAVAHPVEGTILTVADTVAAAAVVDPDPAHLTTTAAAAVADTPNQLEALGGSIDSGAAGLEHFFDALARLGGDTHRGELIECGVGDEPVGNDPERLPLGGPTPGREFAGHEIQFRVPTTVVDAESVSVLLSTLGTDVVVAATATEVAAHVHVADANVAVRAISAELEGRLGTGAISYDVERILESDSVSPALHD